MAAVWQSHAARWIATFADEVRREGFTMTEAMAEARLAVAKGRIDSLEEDARGSREEKSRIDRHLEALRKAHASARAAASAAGSRFEDALAELGTKLTIAEHRRAAEVARGRDAFVRSVEAELHAWDSYLEQLERRAAVQTGSGLAGVSTSELRRRRNEVARRLGDARIAPDGAWRERRERAFERWTSSTLRPARPSGASRLVAAAPRRVAAGWQQRPR
jgi:hypothetical protein